MEVGSIAPQDMALPKENAGELLTSIRCGGRLLSLAEPVVMGIVNVTTDSFYAKSRCRTALQIRRRVEQVVREGAAIVDLGACSTRPGSLPVDEGLELRRLRRAVAIVREVAPQLPISIDTYRASVAEALIEEFGVEIINDISAGEMDPAMFGVVARHGVAHILTHIQGTPTSMQMNPIYTDVVAEVLDFFVARVNRLRVLGVADVILDPGFGFGKTVEHNYTLLRNLGVFSTVGLPVLAGVARKSMIFKVLEVEPKDALLGTQSLDTIALLNGARILRVHDVLPAVQAVKLCRVYQEQAVW